MKSFFKFLILIITLTFYSCSDSDICECTYQSPSINGVSQSITVNYPCGTGLPEPCR